LMIFKRKNQSLVMLFIHLNPKLISLALNEQFQEIKQRALHYFL